MFIFDRGSAEHNVCSGNKMPRVPGQPSMQDCPRHAHRRCESFWKWRII